MNRPTAIPSFQEALDTSMRETIASVVKTSIPGIVESYDPSTKRADILPAVRRDMSNGAVISRALLLDVPVISPSTGGVMVYNPLKKGDVVYVFFSERGIGRFKRFWEESDPDPGRYFHAMDAVAVHWGVETIAPVDEDAFCIQSKDGNTYIKLKDGLIEMRCGNQIFRLTPNRGDFV